MGSSADYDSQNVRAVAGTSALAAISLDTDDDAAETATDNVAYDQSVDSRTAAPEAAIRPVQQQRHYRAIESIPTRLYRCPPIGFPLYRVDGLTITILASDGDRNYWPSERQEAASNPVGSHLHVSKEHEAQTRWKRKCAKYLAQQFSLGDGKLYRHKFDRLQDERSISKPMFCFQNMLLMRLAVSTDKKNWTLADWPTGYGIFKRLETGQTGQLKDVYHYGL